MANDNKWPKKVVNNKYNGLLLKSYYEVDFFDIKLYAQLLAVVLLLLCLSTGRAVQIEVQAAWKLELGESPCLQK